MTKLSIDREMRRAKANERKGAIDEARGIYAAILQKYPNNKRARNALADLQAAGGDSPSSAPTGAELAKLQTLYQSGQLTALAAEATALAKRFPSSFTLWNILGAANLGLNRLNDAEANFRKAAEANPGHPDAFNNLGVLLQNKGRIEEAVKCYQQTLLLKPDHADAHYNLAAMLWLQDKLEEAEEHYRKVLQIAPGKAEAHNKLGRLLRMMGRLADAEASCRKALQIAPGYAEAHIDLGIVLRHQGRLSDAEECCREALRIKPDYAEAFNELGITLREEGKFAEAFESFRRSLQFMPDSAGTWNNLGSALVVQGRLDEAVEGFQRALDIEKGNNQVLAQKLRAQTRMCDWTACEEFEAVKGTLGLEGLAVPPFSMLAFEDHPKHQAKRSRLYRDQMFKQERFCVWPERRPGKIRVGFFSPDFRDHAFLSLTAGLFREHDKSRFEFFAYGYTHGENSKKRAQLKRDVSQFLEITEMPDRDVVDLARGHGLDIAIDCAGYTLNSRSRLFAYGLAPIQISYLGFPGTMGADFIDYIVADPMVIPPLERPNYTEEVIYLPNTYWPTDNQQEIAKTQTSRADFGLPERGFVFCCFNQAYKIGPCEFDVWMRLLTQVEGSVLWLLGDNKWTKSNLRKEAESRGVNPERIVFAEKLSLSEHLARHKHADLFLDTFNYNAHTTASDALWAGLPLVTKTGWQFSARVAASQLTAIGMPDLITGSEEEYEALILELATNPEQLATIRSRLAENRSSQSLFDTERYTRDFEQALRQCYQRYVDGMAPQHMRVEAQPRQ